MQTVDAKLAFTKPEDVLPDERRPGLFRSRALDLKGEPDNFFDLHACRVHDCDELGFEPDLLRHGFAQVDLSQQHALQVVLDGVRRRGCLERQDRSAIRRGLRGAVLELGRHRLKVLSVAREGLIMRVGGPAGLGGDPDAGPNGERPEPAVNAHADQDVGGTPLRQLMRGFAPWIFRHESPQGSNPWSPLCLVNVWIPLQQITRPLAIMDRGSLDRRRHQLRFGLPTDSFLEREEGSNVNDIWTFLHHPRQRWYFTSEMDARRAYVFQTLSTPHGAFVLPGEDVAAERSRALGRAVELVLTGDEIALRQVAEFQPSEVATTRPLARAIDEMERLLRQARAQASTLCTGVGRDTWVRGAQEAMDRVVRKSVELRAVAAVLPNRWPFDRLVP